ncbi:hypothetical protein JHK86_035504 [Glycine max]|nr:hypothetical protein JHK86_035504 [Glycine max]
MLSVSSFRPPAVYPTLLHCPRLHHVNVSLFCSLSNGASSSCRSLGILRAIDRESEVPAQQLHHVQNQKLKIGIIGFGKFGQFLARTLVRQGHTVLAHSRSDYTHVALELGVTFFENPHDLCDERPEVILLCCSILSARHVLLTLPLQRLEPGTLFVDVLSVKEFPKKLLLDVLPSNLDILCSHPMFGPDSASCGWSGRRFMFDKVRIRNEERCNMFLDVFKRERCEMVEMSCEDHDKLSAKTQFITHTIGRVLGMLDLEKTRIYTKGYESLLNLKENTAKDSFDLYYGLFILNKNSPDMLGRLCFAFQELRKQLLKGVHVVVREHLFENPVTAKVQNLQDTASFHSDVSEYKSSLSSDYSYNNLKLKIAIVGFGNFGQFLAKTIVRQGHQVLAYSRSDYSTVAKELGVTYFRNADDLCAQHPEVILLCTSILSTEGVLKSFPWQKLERSTLFVDVLSVKEFHRNLFLQHLPLDFDVLCTHPMFGPQSAKDGWSGFLFVFDKVRIGTDEARTSRCDLFLNIFSSEGCQLVEMSCAEHDRQAVGSQFITHTVGRMLEKLDFLEPTKIDTIGFESLLNLMDNTVRDSFDLYNGLFLFNENSRQQLEEFHLAFESLQNQLLDHALDNLKQVLILEEESHD